NVPLRSRVLFRSTGPLDVCTVLRVLPFRRLPSWRSSSSRCDSISPSKAASRKLFSNGANAPSLPYNDLPERNCSRAFFLISSRLNCSSFFCSITCVKVGDFSGFDTVHFTASSLPALTRLEQTPTFAYQLNRKSEKYYTTKTKNLSKL